MEPVGANALGLAEATGAVRGALLQSRHCHRPTADHSPVLRSQDPGFL